MFSFDLYEYKKLVHKLKKKKSKKKRKREESRIKIVLIKTILQLYRYQKNNNSKLRAKKKKKQNILTHLKCSAKYFFFFKISEIYKKKLIFGANLDYSNFFLQLFSVKKKKKKKKKNDKKRAKN